MPAIILGCTVVLRNDGYPGWCVCCLDEENGEIFEYDFEDERPPFSPVPGTPLFYVESDGFEPWRTGRPGSKIDIVKQRAKEWSIQAESFQQLSGVGRGPQSNWLMLRSPGIFDGDLRWYPPESSGGPASSRDRRIPRRPGAFGGELRKEVVRTTFALQLVEDGEGRFYKGVVVCRGVSFELTVKYNEARTNPPEVLPVGSVLGVFVSVGGGGSKYYNPEDGLNQVFAYLKIGSIIYTPGVELDDSWPAGHEESGESFDDTRLAGHEGLDSDVGGLDVDGEEDEDLGDVEGELDSIVMRALAVLQQHGVPLVASGFLGALLDEWDSRLDFSGEEDFAQSLADAFARCITYKREEWSLAAGLVHAPSESSVRELLSDSARWIDEGRIRVLYRRWVAPLA
jgi:hypothetical protein